VAAFGEVLRGSIWAQGYSLADVAAHAATLGDRLGDSSVAELADLTRRAAALGGVDE
jgi:hypothetical protein